jgi:N-acetylmuramoyl-L-alanine amidase
MFKVFLPIVFREPPLPEPDPPLVVEDIRDQLVWHATKKYSKRPWSWLRGIAFHHVGAKITTSNPLGISTPYNVSSYHVNWNDWPGIGYAIWIERNGLAYLTNLFSTVSYHVGDPNWKSIGVVLNGNYMYPRLPTDAQLETGNKVCNWLYQNPDFGHQITEVYGHGFYPGGTPTACPGSTYPQWFYEMVKKH